MGLESVYNTHQKSTGGIFILSYHSWKDIEVIEDRPGDCWGGMTYLALANHALCRVKVLKKKMNDKTINKANQVGHYCAFLLL